MSVRRRSSQALVMTVLVAQFAACGGGGSSAPAAARAVASVAVTPAVATLVSLGETLQLTATAHDANGNAIAGKTFTWSSSDESIATVTDSGLVTALANGPAVTIAAATVGVRGTAAVRVGRRPSARAFHGTAYDAVSDQVILYGGHAHPDPNKGTWAYDLDTNSWTDMNPPTSPDADPFPRSDHAMAYDAQSDRVILFGGFAGFVVGETWAYDFNSNSWTDMSATPSPTARGAGQMVYDTRSDRVILFGGVNGIIYDETWAYDFDTNAWTQLSPSTKPPPEACFALAYDAESDRVILFGFDQRHATWAYDFNTNAWTDMNPERSPRVQDYHAMTYDAGSDRVILFGGTGGSETWAYDFNTNRWTRMNPVVHPSARWGHRMVYHARSERIILFGGERIFEELWSDETWAYDFNTDTWTPVH